MVDADRAAGASRGSRATERSAPARLRRDAEGVAGGLPALLAKAERLASTVVLGAHGRRRAGTGETFWQYRRATPGDPLPSVDWRRSARSDALYVRETEWEAAQTVWLWCDRSRSMAYRAARDRPEKIERAAVLTAALAVLLTRGGERISLLGGPAARPSSGERQLGRAIGALCEAEPREWGAPPRFEGSRGGRAVFVGDFFGDEEELLDVVADAASQGLTGMLLQVVDPVEESFPFGGRTVFESMGRSVRYETDRADALREDYKTALARRRARLSDIAWRRGWRFAIHRTSESPAPALLWLAEGLRDAYGGGR